MSYVNTDCTASGVTPVIDGILTATNAIALGIAMVSGGPDKDLRIFGGLVATSAFLGSAVYGRNRIDECRELLYGPPTPAKAEPSSSAARPAPTGRLNRSPDGSTAVIAPTSPALVTPTRAGSKSAGLP